VADLSRTDRDKWRQLFLVIDQIDPRGAGNNAAGRNQLVAEARNESTKRSARRAEWKQPLTRLKS
jgi:hypothetical protein